MQHTTRSVTHSACLRGRNFELRARSRLVSAKVQFCILCSELPLLRLNSTVHTSIKTCISHPDCTSGVKRHYTSSEILARFARSDRMHMLGHRTQRPESFSTICSGPQEVLVAKNTKSCTHEHTGQAETSASCFQLKASRRHERADIFDQAKGQ